MVLAQIAIVLSRGTFNGKQTLSIGILSNAPYEERKEAPTVMFATIDVQTCEAIQGEPPARY